MRIGGAYWLGKRVQVGAACSPSLALARGVVIAYAAAPTITVRDEQGRDSTWQTTLPIDVLGEAEDSELPAILCGGRSVDTGSVWIVWDFNWVDHELQVKGTFATELEAKVFNRVEGVGQGWGVQEVALPERAEPDLASRTYEAMMVKYAEAGQLREERDLALGANIRQAGMIHERDAKLRVANERAEEAERRLANVREMVHRLRVAAGGGVTPGYVLVRIEDMLNGQEPT